MLTWLNQENGEKHTFVEIDKIQCRLGLSPAARILALVILDIEPLSEQYEELLKLNIPFSARRISISLENHRVVLIRQGVDQLEDSCVGDLLDAAKRCIAELDLKGNIIERHSSS